MEFFMYALLIKREFKMAGYWNCVFVDRERGQYPAHLPLELPRGRGTVRGPQGPPSRYI